QRGVDLLPHVRRIGLALGDEEIGQISERLANRRIGGEERALCSHNPKNLLGQLALAGVAAKRRLVAHDRCSSASTSSRNISRYFSVSQAMSRGWPPARNN